jgi:hypothetical protein
MPQTQEYDAILSRSWDEIPESQTLPDGSYLLRGRNAAYVGGKGDNSPKVLFFFSVKEAMDDVDSEALAALGDDYDLSDNQIVATFWIEGNRSWNDVKEFLKKAGVETKGKSQQQSLKDFKGAEIISFLKARTYTNSIGEVKVENYPTQFAAVEA